MVKLVIYDIYYAVHWISLVCWIYPMINIQFPPPFVIAVFLIVLCEQQDLRLFHPFKQINLKSYDRTACNYISKGPWMVLVYFQKEYVCLDG